MYQERKLELEQINFWFQVLTLKESDLEIINYQHDTNYPKVSLSPSV